MAEVRRGVDRLDEGIAALLAERFRYMEAAARIKPDREAVRDEWRKADDIAKVSSAAAREGGPAARIALLYDALIEHSRSEERRVGKECVSRVDLGGRRLIKKKQI